MARALFNAGVAMVTLLATAEARAQYTPPPPPLTSAPCVPTKKEPCPAPAAPAPKNPNPADAFPFPDDTPANNPSGSNQFPFPGDAPASSSPSASPSGSKTGSAADAPDTPDAAAAKKAQQDHPFPDDDSSSSSSSSSSESDADKKADDKSDAKDKQDLKDLGGSGAKTKRQRGEAPQDYDPVKREAEDLKVSKFYEDTGNFRAAYMRAQDAVKTQPDDPDAHLRLAQMAEKLARKDEAVAEYNLYLKLDPDGEKVKKVKEALEALR